jgi:7-carboxy-7-deazaguanine synthase
MNKLVLAKEGVFPIVKDGKGQRVSQQPNTGLGLSGTVQGEGKLAGVPSIFIRLSSCNLRCIWQMKDGSFCHCDTTYASFHPNETAEMEIDEIVALVEHNLGCIKHVVITGGEPLLQKKPLALLCQRLKEKLNVHLTLESNGTLFDAEVARWIDLFSISPKLSNSIPNEAKLSHYQLQPAGPYKFHADKRLNLTALQSYIDLCRSSNKELQLKFVIGQAQDDLEIKTDFVDHLKGLQQADIMLMPLGANRKELEISAQLVLRMAIENGWRYSPRIHIDLFDSKSGV